jgi:hypothetical protein
VPTTTSISSYRPAIPSSRPLARGPSAELVRRLLQLPNWSLDSPRNNADSRKSRAGMCDWSFLGGRMRRPIHITGRCN